MTQWVRNVLQEQRRPFRVQTLAVLCFPGTNWGCSRSPANQAAHTCSQWERSPEPSPKRDAAGVSRSLLFHPPFLHIVRTRVPPRVQRPQAEPEPVTPGCNEGRGARNLSRVRNTVAILSGPGPNQLRHPGWGGSVRGGPLPAEADSAPAPPTSGSDPRAGVPLGTLQDGSPHGAVWDAPGSENSYGSPFSGRLVATALEGRLHWAPQCALHWMKGAITFQERRKCFWDPVAREAV